MISITTIAVGDPDGVLFYENIDTVLMDTPPRVSRSATLDGGSVVDHRGFCDGDREFKIKAQLTEDQAEDLWNIYRSETLVNISCGEGFFQGAISRMKLDGGRLEMTFLVKGD